MITNKAMKNVMMNMKVYNALTFFMMQKTEVRIKVIIKASVL